MFSYFNSSSSEYFFLEDMLFFKIHCSSKDITNILIETNEIKSLKVTSLLKMMLL